MTDFDNLPQNFLVNLMKKLKNPKNVAVLSQIHRRTRNTVMRHPEYQKKKENKNRRNIHKLLLANNSNQTYNVYENPNNNRYEYRLFKTLPQNQRRLIRLKLNNGTVKVYPHHVRQNSHYLIIL